MNVCDWPVKFVACSDTSAEGTCSVLDELSEEARRSFERRASDLLWEWSGRVFGQCVEVVRPCHSRCGVRPPTFEGMGPYAKGSSAPSGWFPLSLSNGFVGNVWCGDCGNAGCGCGENSLKSLALPGPVVSVERVVVDGIVLDTSAYMVMYGRYLVRTDGGVWPRCQSLMQPSTEVGTFEVTYTRGVKVPEGGQVAAGVLACELAKAACNDSTCRLPKRVQTVTRQGITVGFMDAFEDLAEGRVGIWEVDAWLSSVNRPKSVSRIASVDRR